MGTLRELREELFMDEAIDELYNSKKINTILNSKKMGTKTVITYSWATSAEISHKISGHLFEACDLYLTLLENDQNVSNDTIILLPELKSTQIENCIKAIKDKYKEWFFLKLMDVIYCGRPMVIDAPVVYVCDGTPPDCMIKANEVNLILCAKDLWWATQRKKENFNSYNDARIKKITADNIYILYNAEIHKEPLINKLKRNIQEVLPKQNCIFNDSYTKNINPERYRLFEEILVKNLSTPTKRKETALMYITGNCRSLESNINILANHEIEGSGSNYTQLQMDIINAINKSECTKLILAGVDEDDSFAKDLIDNIKDSKYFFVFGRYIEIEVIPENELPIKDIHDKFDTYIYTPTGLNWDCSPRFIKECAYLQKEVIFTDYVLYNMFNNYGLKYAYNEMVDYSIMGLEDANKINSNLIKGK